MLRKRTVGLTEGRQAVGPQPRQSWPWRPGQVPSRSERRRVDFARAGATLVSSPRNSIEPGFHGAAGHTRQMRRRRIVVMRLELSRRGWNARKGARAGTDVCQDALGSSAWDHCPIPKSAEPVRPSEPHRDQSRRHPLNPVTNRAERRCRTSRLQYRTKAGRGAPACGQRVAVSSGVRSSQPAQATFISTRKCAPALIRTSLHDPCQRRLGRCSGAGARTFKHVKPEFQSTTERLCQQQDADRCHSPGRNPGGGATQRPRRGIRLRVRRAQTVAG